jgi:flagellar hook-basal body complex protein FliE
MAPTNPMSLQPLPLLEGGERLQELVRNPEFARMGGADESESGVSFVDTLKNSIAQVNEAQLQADEAITGILTGNQADVAGTMIAVQKANISFQLMTQVRNKIVEAYEKVMRMPV